ncbi:MAG: NAD(P)-dependent oxidoreductase [Herpetosiphon sp.]
MKRVLLTGGSGFIGRHATQPLLDAQYEIHAVSSVARSGDSVIWHRADLLDSRSTTELVREIAPTHLLHFAWYAVPGAYWRSPENFRWVGASLHLLNAFAEYGGKRVVMAGTCAEYDWTYGHCSEAHTPLMPTTPYGVCKHALQLMLAAHASNAGLCSAWGRIFFLYGPHEHPNRLVASVIRSLLAGEAARCSHGNQVRDFLHVQDVADAFVSLLESGVTGPVNIASGQPTTIKDVVGMIAERLGQRSLVQLGVIDAPANDPRMLVADVGRLRDEVGWHQMRSLERGIDDTIAWWNRKLQS